MRRAILLLTLIWPSVALTATPTNDMTVAHWWTDPYWWIQALAAVATMLAVVVALFGQAWRRKFPLEIVS